MIIYKEKVYDETNNLQYIETDYIFNQLRGSSITSVSIPIAVNRILDTIYNKRSARFSFVKVETPDKYSQFNANLYFSTSYKSYKTYAEMNKYIYCINTSDIDKTSRNLYYDTDIENINNAFYSLFPYNQLLKAYNHNISIINQ